MGTNFYATTNRCECCGRFDTDHIGKRSAGWLFGFHGNRDPDAGLPIRSFKDWRTFLAARGAVIEDEYGRTYTLEEFVALVEETREPWGPEGRRPLSHAREFPEPRHDTWTDDEGWPFTGHEFS